MNIRQIFEAWIIATHPTENQIILAEARYEICNNCSSKKKLVIEICRECGCPISKKIFTNDFNPCPLKKWEDTDNKYFKFEEEKKEKTLI